MADQIKVALLVGAGDAIGAGVARRFARGGYHVCVARREASKSASLIDEIKTAGGNATVFSTDARDEVAVQALFSDIEGQIGPIEVCLFNAGANVAKPLLETTDKLFFRVWQLGCYAGFLVGREATRHMMKRGRGTILFTGATASLRGGKNFAAFSAAKFGLRAISQSMARELGPKSIHVAHLIVDGSVDSPEIHRRLKADKGIDASTLPKDSMIQTSSIAEVYWYLAHQPRDAWTQELDLRPAAETW